MSTLDLAISKLRAAIADPRTTPKERAKAQRLLGAMPGAGVSDLPYEQRLELAREIVRLKAKSAADEKEKKGVTIEELRKIFREIVDDEASTDDDKKKAKKMLAALDETEQDEKKEGAAARAYAGLTPHERSLLERTDPFKARGTSSFTQRGGCFSAPERMSQEEARRRCEELEREGGR